MSALTFGFTAQQIIKEGSVTEEGIALVKNWLITQNLPKLTDEQIVHFLVSSCNNQELTTTTIRTFYTIRRDAPQLFDNRKLEQAVLQKQLNTVECCIFPKQTNDGSSILLMRLYDTIYFNYDLLSSMKIIFMTLDGMVRELPSKGLIIIVDMKGSNLMHFTRMRFGLLKIFIKYLQEGLPMRLRAVHLLNIHYFLDKFVSTLKPFIKKEVFERTYFHTANMDMKEFYKNCIPKQCMPEDYGGDLPSVRILHKENVRKLFDLQPFFEAEELQRHRSIND